MAQKPSSSLQKYLATKKVETRLVGPIERYLLSRPRDTSRRRDVIHPSALCKKDYCARWQYFEILGEAAREDAPNLRLQSIFDEGHAIHHKWQNWIRGMGNLYGKWMCRACHTTFWATSPFKCEACPSDDLLEYREVPLVDDDLMIAGHADGWVKGIDADYLIEIKSVGSGTIRMENPSLFKDGADLSQAWRNIRRPFPTYVRQALLYIEIGHRMVANGLLDSFPEEVVILMELKADQSYKEFVVKRDPEVVKDMLDMAYDIARAVRTETPPPCSVGLDGCKACEPFKEENK